MANARVNFTANTSNFQKGAASVRSSIKGIASTVATIAAPLAGLIGIGAALGAAFKGVSLAADMEATETSFSTLLGSLTDAKALLGEIAETAKSTPYGFTDLAASARKLLAVTDKESVTSTLRMIGDLASASQKPITELAAMYAKIKGGDIVQGQDLNQIGDALGGQALEEFAKVLGVDSVKAVRKLGSQGKITGADLETVFRNLTSQGGMAFNAMAAQSGTFLGLISTLKDNWEALLRTFGKPIMLALKPFLQDGISLLESMQAKAQAFGEAVGKSITFLRNIFKGGEIFSFIKTGLELAAKGFANTLIGALAGVGAIISKVFGGMSKILSGIFNNPDLWTGLFLMVEALGMHLGVVINKALPKMMGGQDKELQSKSAQFAEIKIDLAKGHFGIVSERAGMHAGAMGEDLRNLIPIFSRGFKENSKFFDTSEAAKDMREMWKRFTTPLPTEQETETSAATPNKVPFTPQVLPKEAFPRTEPILSSLARIGGAKSLTANPLVNLQKQANGFLERIERNTSRTTAATYA